MHNRHIPVLGKEAIVALDIHQNGIYIDATFGRGGHTALILSCLGKEGRLFVMDRDPQALALAKTLADPRIFIIPGAFSTLFSAIEAQGLLGKVNGILLDLGVSSPQLEDAERGFSFMRDGPLDMRMDPLGGISAAHWLSTASVEEIAYVLKTFGEERFATRIARAIVTRNKTATPLTSTKELAELIANSIPYPGNKHPATRSFQGIRIYINDELNELNRVLTDSLAILAPQGRLAVISFHSLEDRLVKQFIQLYGKGIQIPNKLPLTQKQLQREANCRLKSLGKIKPSRQEIDSNPRARSAILRIAELL